ncbi:MAG: bacteriohemerythrin [Agathobacter sp.]|nr:bacteriohemerythrin [Agathobacter sp.]
MIKFTDDCIIGIEEIDNEHRYLFELLNRVNELIAEDYHNDYYQQVKDMLAELDDYADQHFTHEEAYMEQIRDPELILQRAQHAYFREKVLTLDLTNIDEFEEQRRVLYEIVTFLAKWLYHHIISSDMMIGKFPPLEEWMLKENPCEFTEEYLTGIELIDKEHEELFSIVAKANDLVRNYDPSSSYDKILGILNELRDYTAEHFRDEEEYMEFIGYEGLAAQKRAHENFIAKLETIDYDQIENDTQGYLQSLLEFLLGWLINHILNSDKKIPAPPQEQA